MMEPQPVQMMLPPVVPNFATAKSSLIPDTLVIDAKLAIVVMVTYVMVSMCPVSELMEHLLPQSVFALPFADMLIKGLIIAIIVATITRLFVFSTSM